LFKLLSSVNKIPVADDEVLFVTPSATPETVVVAWQQQSPSQFTKLGHQVIESSGAHFYLYKPTFNATSSWINISNMDNAPVPRTQRKLLLGGEVEMWTDDYCYVEQCHPQAR
jgi:hypothetical protein